MATGRHRIARTKRIYIYPDRTVEINPGDIIPLIIELDGAAESLDGGPVFEGTDVPIEYAHYYMDKVHNLHAFLSDYPSVSRERVMVAVEERLLERIDSLINSDREYVSGQPRFNGTRMTVYTLFQVLADGDDINTFLSEYDTSVTHELCRQSWFGWRSCLWNSTPTRLLSSEWDSLRTAMPEHSGEGNSYDCT